MNLVFAPDFKSSFFRPTKLQQQSHHSALSIHVQHNFFKKISLFPIDASHLLLTGIKPSLSIPRSTVLENKCRFDKYIN